MLRIEVFPASYGDSFLVTCTGEQKCYLLIDMGFMSTYSKSIKAKLLEIKNNGESLSLMILTHVDDDHISGAIKFFAENEYHEHPQIVRVENIWFNSYRHLQFEKKYASDKVLTDENSFILENLKGKERPREQGLRSIGSIGAIQGSTLASLLYHYKYLEVWNSHFNKNAVLVEKQDDETLKRIQLTDEVSITILSPDINKLSALDALWKEKLVSEGYKGPILSSELMDDAFEVYSVNYNGKDKRNKKLYKVSSHQEVEKIANAPIIEDCSPVNGSSIAFILEFQNKKVLFLADSHPDIIVENLKKIMLKEKIEKIHFDAVKISHHGSKHNTSNELLEIIDTDKYIFSTNGRGKGFVHPDIETVLKIITVKTDRKKTLIFNYKPVHIFQIINNNDLIEKYNYEIIHMNDASVGKDNYITTINI
ncbi:Zn-dependent hydrolase [Paenibacillus xylanexedens]|uniref:Zn-dependent hydrolase n=1 Tax=Paenibacillus xylanexedens TaxID=528191 RepID=UPI0011A5AFAA|nr:Zn-dependent hydrolase [Paenibacillus xylanexedens]